MGLASNYIHYLWQFKFLIVQSIIPCVDLSPFKQPHLDSCLVKPLQMSYGMDKAQIQASEVKYNYRKKILDLFFLSLHLRCNLLFTTYTIGSRRVDSVLNGRLDRPQTTLRLPGYYYLLRVVRRKFTTINMLIGRKINADLLTQKSLLLIKAATVHPMEDVNSPRIKKKRCDVVAEFSGCALLFHSLVKTQSPSSQFCRLSLEPRVMMKGNYCVNWYISDITIMAELPNNSPSLNVLMTTCPLSSAKRFQFSLTQ